MLTFRQQLPHPRPPGVLGHRRPQAHRPGDPRRTSGRVTRLPLAGLQRAVPLRRAVRRQLRRRAAVRDAGPHGALALPHRLRHVDELRRPPDLRGKLLDGRRHPRPARRRGRRALGPRARPQLVLWRAPRRRHDARLVPARREAVPQQPPRVDAPWLRQQRRRHPAGLGRRRRRRVPQHHRGGHAAGRRGVPLEGRCRARLRAGLGRAGRPRRARRRRGPGADGEHGDAGRVRHCVVGVVSPGDDGRQAAEPRQPVRRHRQRAGRVQFPDLSVWRPGPAVRTSFFT